MDYTNTLQIVVARYKEPLHWLNHYPFCRFPAIIYNKGGEEDYCKAPNIIKEVTLPNSGLDVHSFLYHIIHNYDNLAEITAFFQGSVDLLYKYDRAVNTIIESVNRRNTVLAVTETYDNVKTSLYNFELDYYQMSHPTVEKNLQIAYYILAKLALLVNGIMNCLET